MIWFRCAINMAHVGAGKAVDEVVYIQAPDAVAAMDVVSKFPGAKKSRRGTAGNNILPVDGVPADGRRWYYWDKKTSTISVFDRASTL